MAWWATGSAKLELLAPNYKRELIEDRKRGKKPTARPLGGSLRAGTDAGLHLWVPLPTEWLIANSNQRDFIKKIITPVNVRLRSSCST